jgi:phosphonatase-like hydrolase
MKYELIVFDLAGTTVKDNKDVHRVLQSAMSKHNIDISIEDANDVMGIPKPVAIRQLLSRRYKGEKPITNAWIDDIHHQFVREMISFYKHDASVGERDGVTETFRNLKAQGIKVAVDTGFDRQITQPLLARLGWITNKLIDFSVTSDEVPNGRPYPDMIFEAMKHTGVKDVKKVVKVGDTVSDILEGNAAGCGLVVGVTSGSFTYSQLQDEKPDYLIHEVSEVLDLLR